ncbi:MAG: efflux RND transporter periplasmic adaptor subunit [Chlorobia bacterium]|nr:efflux RND transporter periplasmic adaptor subunit [Fimbriimonadaceae bacterium]
MKRFGIISMAALAFVGVGCVDRPAQEQAKTTEAIVSDPTVTVTAQPVSIQTLQETLAITGQVTTSSDSQVGAKNSGKIIAVYVKDGDPVSVGQTIAVQDTASLSAQLSQALASVQTAASSMQSANAQLSQASQNARIQPTRSASAVRQAEAQLRSARAQLSKSLAGAREEDRVQAEWSVKQAKSSLDKAQKDLDRYTKLVAEGAVAAALLEQYKLNFDTALSNYNAALQRQLALGNRREDIDIAREAVRQAEEGVRGAKAQQALDINLNEQVQAARAQINAARAQIQSAQAQVTIARQAIADSTIKAPFSGKISGNPVQPGTVVGPGSPVARIVGKEGNYFEGEVPESNIDKIGLGSPVTVSVNALSGVKFAGIVRAISPFGESVGRLFKVRVAFSGDTSTLRPGMYATGEIVLRTIPNAATVPSMAIVKRDGKDVVFVLDGDKAKQVPVTTGLQTGGVIQVTGLTAGQQVVVAGQNALDNGAKIKVDTAKQAGV